MTHTAPATPAAPPVSIPITSVLIGPEEEAAVLAVLRSACLPRAAVSERRRLPLPLAMSRMRSL